MRKSKDKDDNNHAVVESLKTARAAISHIKEQVSKRAKEIDHAIKTQNPFIALQLIEDVKRDVNIAYYSTVKAVGVAETINIAKEKKIK